MREPFVVYVFVHATEPMLIAGVTWQVAAAVSLREDEVADLASRVPKAQSRFEANRKCLDLYRLLDDRSWRVHSGPYSRSGGGQSSEMMLGRPLFSLLEEINRNLEYHG